MRRLVLAVLAAMSLLSLYATPAPADQSEYGFESVSASLSSNQAGDHPDFSIALRLRREQPANIELPSTTRDIAIELPPGLLANPGAVPKCTAAQLATTDIYDPSNETGCPQASQIGIAEVEVFKGGELLPLIYEPLFNMDAPGGDTVARIGFMADFFPIFADARLRSDGDYGATVTVSGASSIVPLLSATSTVWGVPAAESHDAQRITAYEAVHNNGAPETPSGKRPSGLVPAPFMLNPTRCGAPREVRLTATPYAAPEEPAEASVPLAPVTGCGSLEFAPKLTLAPTSRRAAQPTGLDADLTIPQNENPNALSTSQLRFARVELPRGVTIASGAADGLEACSAAQVGYGMTGASHCPDAAKIGSAEFDSPALSRVIDGAVYQRTPVKGNLFGIWLVTDELGVHLKLPGEVHLDPNTGQIVTTFEGVPATEGLPQAPVREFQLHFFGGPRAPLAAPQACGTYLAHYEFVPWSGGKPVEADAPMTFDEGCNTGGFIPKLSAGSIKSVAGAFSPFVTELSRESGEQNIAGLDVTLPPGVLAKIAGVELCEGNAAQTGNCPFGSQVGTTTVATGPGSNPLWIPQPGKDPTAVYLSGPYRGAPYSLVVRTPAQAGPFDLGTVVTRAAIAIDPQTAQATVSSDPLPQFLEGVPISYRTIHVDVNRPEFTLNPTGCDEEQVTSKVTSDTGAIANPSAGFQATSCRDLGFKPKLFMRLFGKSNRGAHPRFRAVLKPRRKDSNTAWAQVALPHSEFLDQGHIRTICTRVQFAADSCPTGAIYGHAVASSPLLDRPLEGPVYLRSSSHELPDLVVALKGQVDFNLVGRIDSIRGGIRTTFASAPDAPVSKFILTMQGGRKGLLVNSRNICRAPGRALAEFEAHNERTLTLHPELKASCG